MNHNGTCRAYDSAMIKMLNHHLFAVLGVALLMGGCDRSTAPAPAPAPAPQPAAAPTASAAPSAPTTRPGEDAAAPSTRPAAPSSTPASEWQPPEDRAIARFGGLQGPKPVTWIEHPPSHTMRLANYTVPGRDGSEAAHIVVFYFGQGQGGSIDMNIDRWQSQFRPDDEGNLPEPIVETLATTGGHPITLVELEGDWMKMGQRWYTPDQMFIAAIIEAPIGMLFVRFAGDPQTVSANREAFVSMVEGLEAN